MTARVTYAMSCGVPIARRLMCRDALGLRYPNADAIRRRVDAAIGSGSLADILAAGAAIRDAERGVGSTDAGTAELRTAPNNAGPVDARDRSTVCHRSRRGRQFRIKGRRARFRTDLSATPSS